MRSFTTGGNIRQLNLSVGIGYRSDVKGALATIHEILKANARVLKDPPPVVGIAALAGLHPSMSPSCRGWLCRDYASRAVGNLRGNHRAIPRARQIDIPFPQREVRLLENAMSVAALAFTAGFVFNMRTSPTPLLTRGQILARRRANHPARGLSPGRCGRPAACRSPEIPTVRNNARKSWKRFPR